jgi:hypothetical protein
VGYSQHEGAERAPWGDEKLQLVDGTHPVVHPAAGSHANFYGEALYLGSSGSEGVGCDDTRGPTFDVNPVVQTIPSDPAAALRAFPWIGYGGRWGELQRAFFNGPTGPNLKSQWTEPIAWSQDAWRDSSIAVPGGGAVGTGATDFFCAAVAKGSNALRRSADNPLPALLILVALIALIAFALTRTTWRPAAPFRLAHRRAWGQILSAALSMYGRRLWLFLGIGILVLPISVIVTLLQAGLLHASSVLGVETQAERGGLLVWAVLTIGSALTLVGLGFVMAATARALAELDAGRTISPLRAYRLAIDAVRPLLGALLIAAFVVSVCLTTVVLLPIAIWLAVRWALLAPAVELEQRSAIAALRRSGRLVSRGWLKVASLIVVGAALAILAGPFLGALLILVTNVPLVWLNVISGLVYAVAMPFVALATVYVYFDMRVRDELVREHGPEQLPAEIEFSG